VLWKKSVMKLGGCKRKRSARLVMLRDSLCKYVTRKRTLGCQGFMQLSEVVVSSEQVPET
jgi:hypothetical protein